MYRLEEIQKILKKYCVVIAGLGGLGSNVAVSLVRAGIGKLIIIDFDRVELSILTRQYYFLDQIGKYKTEAIKETLTRINPEVEIVSYIKR